MRSGFAMILFSLGLVALAFGSVLLTLGLIGGYFGTPHPSAYVVAPAFILGGAVLVGGSIFFNRWRNSRSLDS